jgi:capsid assembly protease
MKDLNLISAFYSEPWAITESKLRALETVLLRHASGESPTDTDLEAIARSRASQTAKTGYQGMAVPDGTAMIPLHGTIVNRPGPFAEFSGATSPQDFAAAVRAAADDDKVKRIVLDVDSPGGTIAGTETAAQAVAYARSKKETVAVSEGLMASAAYWISSQASKIVTGRTGTLGSIGVMMAARDSSHREAMQGIRTTLYKSGRYKGAGTPGVPLDGDAHEYFQSTIDSFFSEFVSAVASGRGLSEDYLRNEVADGRTFIGAEAVRLGLADEIGSLASVLGAEPTTGSTGSASKTNNKPTAMQHELNTELNDEVVAQVDVATGAQAGEGSDVGEPDLTANQDLIDLEAIVAENQRLASDLEGAHAHIAELEAALGAFQDQAVVAFVDGEVLGRGKALPASREALMAHAKRDFAGFKALFACIEANTAVHMDPISGIGPKDASPAANKAVEKYIQARNEAAQRTR